MQKLFYEPHPVTPERKAELRAQGYKILDVRFAPPGWSPLGQEPKAPDQNPVPVKEPARRGRPPKSPI